MSSIKNQFLVRSIDSYLTYDWLKNKHYAKRIPSISYSFGLYDLQNILNGVLTIGKPASPNLCVGICGVENKDFVYELNRLVINDGLPKNIASFFIANSINLLPKMILVSYADVKQNHTGYVYQASNWIYTGKTKERTDIGFDNNSHSRHYDKNIDKKLNRVVRSAKHRYVYFVGLKNDKKKWLNQLKYEIQEYPKEQNLKYDASYKPLIQITLF
jgi:hypothetical protein